MIAVTCVVYDVVSLYSGLGTVFVGLERSAKILARNIADETVQTVEHK